jgi:hypothetical protein
MNLREGGDVLKAQEVAKVFCLWSARASAEHLQQTAVLRRPVEVLASANMYCCLINSLFVIFRDSMVRKNCCQLHMTDSLNLFCELDYVPSAGLVLAMTASPGKKNLVSFSL